MWYKMVNEILQFNTLGNTSEFNLYARRDIILGLGMNGIDFEAKIRFTQPTISPDTEGWFIYFYLTRDDWNDKNPSICFQIDLVGIGAGDHRFKQKIVANDYNQETILLEDYVQVGVTPYDGRWVIFNWQLRTDNRVSVVVSDYGHEKTTYNKKGYVLGRLNYAVITAFQNVAANNANIIEVDYIKLRELEDGTIYNWTDTETYGWVLVGTTWIDV